MDTNELRERTAGITWFHSIDLGTGVVTPGSSVSPTVPQHALGDLRGCSVLDVGAWDGYYSFLAERMGASRVVALDHYVWGLDWAARDRYWAECRAKGVLPDHAKDGTDFWRPDLPGRRGFELAKEALASAVEPVVADFMTADLRELGTFDVVFYFGVLYHMKEPLTALERLRAATRSVAVIETEAVDVPSLPEVSLLTFVAGDDVGSDYGNWYVTSAAGLRSLCLAAGFSRVDIVCGPPRPADKGADAASTTLAGRATRRLGGVLAPARSEPGILHYRVIARAYV